MKKFTTAFLAGCAACAITSGALYAAEGTGVSASEPHGARIFQLPAGLMGKVDTYEIIGSHMETTLDGACKYRVFQAKKWATKTNTQPDGSKVQVWVRDAKNMVNIDEGRLGHGVLDQMNGAEASK